MCLKCEGNAGSVDFRVRVVLVPIRMGLSGGGVLFFQRGVNPHFVSVRSVGCKWKPYCSWDFGGVFLDLGNGRKVVGNSGSKYV